MIFINKPCDIFEIGSKAFNLLNLKIKNTPKTWVIPASFFVRAKKDLKLFNELKNEIELLFEKNKLYAVRSSAIDEDGENASFAGVHDSFLNVKKEELYENIFKVYESAFSNRALEYRKLKGISAEDIKIAVIVQEMVDAEYAGVIFTINPVTDDPDEIIISVTEGFGDKLVSGEVSGSTYVVNGSEIKVKGEDIINKRQIRKILNMAGEVMQKTFSFQDIEFAINGGKVYFLQARPIVAYKGINPHERTLFIDNSNIIESYFGYTSYLTYTFAKDVYRDVYTATLNLGKTRAKIMNLLAPYLCEMLHYYDGKIYYNMNSWYMVNSVFSFKKSSSYMENMMGVKSKAQKVKRVRMNAFDVMKLGVLFIKKVVNLDKLIDGFDKNFNRIISPYYGKKIDGSNSQLFELFKNIEKDIVKEFAIPVVNDCALMIYFGRLKEKAKKLGILEQELNSYISNNGDVESVGSATELVKIVKFINADNDLKRDFFNLSEKDLFERYHCGSQISDMINEYRMKYGPRVRDELKLETVTMIEDELFVYSIIKENLSVENFDFASERQIKEIPPRLKKLAEKTKKYLKNREKLRMYRTYVYSVVRNIFLGFGRNYCKEGRISEVEDIFYLSKEEVFSGEGDFQSLVKKRKSERELFSNNTTYKRVVFFKNGIIPVKYGEGKDGLRGIPSGAGIVKGAVSLMHGKEDKLVKGNIILTKRTDPGWIGLFPLASGLIVEHGSMLSHSFIVARELGLPAVVGVENATQIIKDGDLVTVDGIKGEIIIEDR